MRLGLSEHCYRQARVYGISASYWGQRRATGRPRACKTSVECGVKWGSKVCADIECYISLLLQWGELYAQPRTPSIIPEATYSTELHLKTGGREPGISLRFSELHGVDWHWFPRAQNRGHRNRLQHPSPRGDWWGSQEGLASSHACSIIMGCYFSLSLCMFPLLLFPFFLCFNNRDSLPLPAPGAFVGFVSNCRAGSSIPENCAVSTDRQHCTMGTNGGKMSSGQ